MALSWAGVVRCPRPSAPDLRAVARRPVDAAAPGLTLPRRRAHFDRRRAPCAAGRTRHAVGHDHTHDGPASRRGVPRNVLARVRWLRRGHLHRHLPRPQPRRRAEHPARHRLPRGGPGLRAHRGDHGLRRGPRLRRPLQPGRSPSVSPSPSASSGRTCRPTSSPRSPAASSPAWPCGGSPAAAPGFEATGNIAANGYGEHSPGGYDLVAVFVAEVLLTAVFLYVILGATDSRAPAGLRSRSRSASCSP